MKKNKYRQSKIGVITILYNSQKFSSDLRNDIKPNYTLYEFKEWVFSQQNFEELYNNWVRSNYNTDFKPSTDRLDDYKPYTLDNLRLVTWKENREHYYSDVKNGINNKANKSVIQMDLSRNFIKEYYSIMQAERETNIPHGNIIKVCKGLRRWAGNYTWKYKS